MKTITRSFLAILFVGMAFSCEDPALDPLQFDSIKKGSILALRGTQLDNIYYQGKPGAEFYPRIIDGSETFDFDAEYLAEDVTTLESFDIFVIKRTKNPDNSVTLERLFLKNVPFSDFKETADYLRPWVSVSIPLTDILNLLGLDYTDPADVDIMLDTYQFGIQIESDLNLKDGSKVLASDLVASGLYQSDQFYPAQVLTYAVIDYCTYDQNSWGGDWSATETSEFFGGYGPYITTFTQDAVDKNKYSTDNWYDSGIPIYLIFTPSTDVPSQIITVPTQNYTSGGGTPYSIVGSGTYNQCISEMVINFTFTNLNTNLVQDQFIWKLVRP
jgi:hypothetical protein